MSEGLTPERRAEIERYGLTEDIKGYPQVRELLAEIDRLAAENARLNKEIDKAKVERAWRAAAAAAGVEHTNLYQLRKLAITRWALTGLPDAVVKTLAGHTDIRLTQNVYARVGMEQILNALEEQRK